MTDSGATGPGKERLRLVQKPHILSEVKEMELGPDGTGRVSQESCL